MVHIAFLALGSNQGEKIKHCESAVEALLQLDATALLARSSWYRTDPWGNEEQDWFINGVIQLATPLKPHELLHRGKEIERALGREDYGQWGPRTIDIDILFHDDLVIKTPDFEIPHPRMHLRNFVLIPMAEIAPHFVHPVFKRDIEQLLDAVADQKKVVRVPG